MVQSIGVRLQHLVRIHHLLEEQGRARQGNLGVCMFASWKETQFREIHRVHCVHTYKRQRYGVLQMIDVTFSFPF